MHDPIFDESKEIAEALWKDPGVREQYDKINADPLPELPDEAELVMFYLEIHLPSINSAPRSAKTVTQKFEDYAAWEAARIDPRNNGKDGRGYPVDNGRFVVGYGIIRDGEKIDCTQDKMKAHAGR